MTGLEKPVRATLARPVRKRRGRWLLPVALLPSLLILILLAFRQQVLDGLGEFLVVSDPLERADLIYVLAGDFWGSRVLSGANLGSKGWAPKVVMSGGLYSGGGDVNRYASDLAVDFAVQHGYPRSLFLPVPMEAQSTIDEARDMGPIFHRLGARRIILVTSNFPFPARRRRSFVCFFQNSIFEWRARPTILSIRMPGGKRRRSAVYCSANTRK